MVRRNGAVAALIPMRPPTHASPEDNCGSTAGLKVLVHHLLGHSTLTPDVCMLARQLLAVDGLQASPVRPLINCNSTPLAFWQKDESATRTVLTVLDLSGAGTEVSIELPPKALVDDDDQLYAVYRHLTSARPPGSGAAALRCVACVAPMAERSSPQIFSGRELLHGQLHVRPPAHGLTSFTIKLAASSLAGGALFARRAHLLSSFGRLARRPRAHAQHNDAAILLGRVCACGDAQMGGHRLLHMLGCLLPVVPEVIEPLALTLTAAVHMAAAGGMLLTDDDATGRSIRSGYNGGPDEPLSSEVSPMAPHDAMAPRQPTGRQSLLAVREALAELWQLVSGGVLSGGRHSSHLVYAHATGNGPPANGPPASGPPANGPPAHGLHSNEPLSNGRTTNGRADKRRDLVGGRTANGHGRSSQKQTPPLASPCRQTTEQLHALRTALADDMQRRRLVFVTPEMGRWASVGGLGVMVSHLSTALAAHGAEPSVIVPAYQCYTSRWAHIPVQVREPPSATAKGRAQAPCVPPRAYATTVCATRPAYASTARAAEPDTHVPPI